MGPSPRANACTPWVDEQHSSSVSGWRAHAKWAAVVSIVWAALGPTDPDRSKRITPSDLSRSGSVAGTYLIL